MQQFSFDPLDSTDAGLTRDDAHKVARRERDAAALLAIALFLSALAIWCDLIAGIVH